MVIRSALCELLLSPLHDVAVTKVSLALAERDLASVLIVEPIVADIRGMGGVGLSRRFNASPTRGRKGLGARLARRGATWRQRREPLTMLACPFATAPTSRPAGWRPRRSPVRGTPGRVARRRPRAGSRGPRGDWNADAQRIQETIESLLELRKGIGYVTGLEVPR